MVRHPLSVGESGLIGGICWWCREERLTSAGDIEATMQFDDHRAVGAVPEVTPASNSQSPSGDKRIMRPLPFE